MYLSSVVRLVDAKFAEATMEKAQMAVKREIDDFREKGVFTLREVTE